MPFEKVDLFEVQLVPVTPAEPKAFSITQLIEQLDAGLSARRFDRYSVSTTLEKIIARVEETTEAQRAEVVDSIWEADPWRIHPGTMRRFFAASWPEAVELFQDVMGSTAPDDLQWGLAARLALCDTALRADKSDRRRLETAKAVLVAFANSCLGRHELLINEKAAGLRGLLDLCARGEIPKNLELEPPRPHEGPKEGDEEEHDSSSHSHRRRGKVGNHHRLPKKSRRKGIPLEKYAGGDSAPPPVPVAPEPAAAPAPPPEPIPAPAAPAPTPIPVAPEPPPPAPSPAVTDEEVWGLLARDGRPVEALKKAYQDCLDILSSGGALHPLSSAKFERLKALVDDAKKRLEAAAKADPFAGVEF